MPCGKAAVAASMYFCTLSVENCGAMGMPDDAPGSDPFDLAYRVGDERSPVAHTHDNGNVEAIGGKLRPKRVTLLERDVGQRRSAADRFPVVGHFSDQLCRRLAPAANQPKVVGHLIDGLRRAVSHQQYRRAWRSVRHARTCSGARAVRAPGRDRPGLTEECRGPD